MRTKLFCLCVFLLLATGLAFAACDKNPAAPSDVSAEMSDSATASDGGVSLEPSEAESDADNGSGDASSADTGDAFSDTDDVSSDTSESSSEASVTYADSDFLASQLDEPFAVWERASPITVTVENPYTDNERWKLWWGETCLYAFGEGTYVYNVAKSDDNAVVTLFTDGGPATVTGRDGKTAELTQERPCVLLDAEGGELLPFGEYERLELVGTYVAAALSADEAYLLNEKGERVSERYTSVVLCPSDGVPVVGSCDVHVTETDGETYCLILRSDGEPEKMPAHTPPGDHEAPNAYVYDAITRQMTPFFEALKTGDRAGIVAVIGEERYNKAAALVDSLEPDYEPYLDYISKEPEERNADKHMAWLLKYARYINGIPPGIYYCEDVSDVSKEPMLRADVNFWGFTGIIFGIAWFADDGSGDYPLLAFELGQTHFTEVP